MIDSDAFFRAALGGLCVIGLGVRLYYQRRFRGTKRVAERARARDTWFYRVVFLSYLLIPVYVLSHYLDFAHVPLPPAVRGFGLALGAGAIVLFVATHRALGRNWSGIVEIAEDHVLVTNGPYARVRHPMYTALLASAASNALVSANWLIAVANFGLTLWMYRARVDDEEAIMLEHFGDAYRTYMNATGRLLPAWRYHPRWRMARRGRAGRG